MTVLPERSGRQNSAYRSGCYKLPLSGPPDRGHSDPHVLPSRLVL